MNFLFFRDFFWISWFLKIYLDFFWIKKNKKIRFLWRDDVVADVSQEKSIATWQNMNTPRGARVCGCAFVRVCVDVCVWVISEIKHAFQALSYLT